MAEDIVHVIMRFKYMGNCTILLDEANMSLIETEERAPAATNHIACSFGLVPGGSQIVIIDFITDAKICDGIRAV